MLRCIYIYASQFYNHHHLYRTLFEYCVLVLHPSIRTNSFYYVLPDRASRHNPAMATLGWFKLPPNRWIYWDISSWEVALHGHHTNIIIGMCYGKRETGYTARLPLSLCTVIGFLRHEEASCDRRILNHWRVQTAGDDKKRVMSEIHHARGFEFFDRGLWERFTLHISPKTYFIDLVGSSCC